MVDSKPLSEKAYRHQQTRRSRGRDYKSVRARVRRAVKWLAAKIPDDYRQFLLDVGSRDGFALAKWKRQGFMEVEGIEFSIPSSTHARSKGLNVATGDMRHLPHADGTFDVVSALHSLEHVPEVDVAIREIFRVLRPGGYLCIAGPVEFETLGSAHYHRWPTPEALADVVVASAGCDVEVITTDLHYRSTLRRKRHKAFEMFVVARKSL